MKPYQKLQRHWRNAKANISTVEMSHESVDRLEASYGIRFPDDFRDYLLHSCPKDDSAFDENTTWWPLNRLKNINEEYEHKINSTEIAKDAAKYIFSLTTRSGVGRGRLVAAATRIGAAWP